MVNQRSFLAELKQRHVVRAAIVYAAAVWALAQGISQLSPAFDLASGVTFWFVIACVIGFPFWIAFAWFFKFTASGIAREDETPKDAAIVHRTGRRLDYWIIGILAVAVVLLLTNQLILQRGKTLHEFAATAVPAVTTNVPAKSIAVLPFENLSADKNNEYFVAGVQDLILTKLADIGGLKVIARTSTEQYKSHPENLAQIGEQLGVATILEGSVQKVGNQVLINVQLINAESDAHIWAQSYPRTLNNIFGVEGEVAGKIATALKATLTPAQSANVQLVSTTNPPAYNLFLRAEYQLNQGAKILDAARMQTAIPLYRKAVEADPGFAVAWARLSYAESITAHFGGGGLRVPKLEAAARKDAAQAQKLAPGAAATQLALGYVAYYGEHAYADALKHFHAALAQRPNDSGAMLAAGAVLRRQHRYRAATAEFERALVLDPRNAVLAFVLARTYLMTHHYAQALTPLRRALAIDPDAAIYREYYVDAIMFGSGNLKRAYAAAQGDAPPLKLARVEILIWQRKYAEAIALLQGIPDTMDNFPVTGAPKAQQLADLYLLAGDSAHAKPLYEEARKQLRAQVKVQSGAPALAEVWSNLADVEFGLGERDAAFAAAAQSLRLASRFRLRLVPRYNAQRVVALFYARTGRADLATPLLAKLLAAPNDGMAFPPVLLRLSPFLDPIRHSPQFQALLKKYAKDKPDVTDDNPPASSSASAH